MRFATVVSESGTDGKGGAVEDVDDEVVLVDEPVSPTEALVAPPLVSQGFGGDEEDMSELMPPQRTVLSTFACLSKICYGVVSVRFGRCQRAG